mmetsp:Transcript_43704/g.57903  ORF Transcript_43704/g.57903 Transcript_43704/m.57903 type:complete len:162 (+) Transcript_43704:521-1006(+)
MASLVLLKDVGKPITVIRVYQEDASSGMIGELLLEYEVPLNVKIEKLSPNLTAMSFTDRGEFLGFYFGRSVADCSLFNMKVDELAETLKNDGTSSSALREVAKQREQEREKAGKKLCQSIDVDVLIKGTGSEEHERELYKFLAAADVGTDDLKKEETMQLI